MEKVARRKRGHKNFVISLRLYAQVHAGRYRYKILIKIASITEAALLREREQEVFRWSSWDKLLPREPYCSHKIRTLPMLTYDKVQMKV